MDYLRDPDEIYRKSFEIISQELVLEGVPDDLHGVATRLVHACGMTDIISDLAFSDDFSTCAKEALASGTFIITDSEMVSAGIMKRYLPSKCELVCRLNDPQTPATANTLGTTRSAAAFELLHNEIDGALVVIGNAPTALFHLLEMLDAGAAKPAAIVGLPVGFVGAAESKLELKSNARGVPFLTLTGRRGGSALAAAAVNALLLEMRQ